MPTPELIQKVQESMKARAASLGPKTDDTVKAAQAEAAQIGMHISRIMLFQIRTMQKEGEFVYAGAGVKLGDKATPILWYKAKDAKSYRVVYGDLHVEDAEKAPPRPATQPAPSGAPIGDASPAPKAK